MLQDSINALVREWDSDTAYDALLDAAVAMSGAEMCGLYIINPHAGSYRLVAKVGREPMPASVPALPRRGVGDWEARLCSYLQQALKSMKPRTDATTFHKRAARTHIIGIAYGSTVYAFLDLQEPESLPLQDPIVRDLRALVELAFMTYQDKIARRALHAQSTPIDITAKADDFYTALGRFLEDATGMQFVALRERGEPGSISPRELRCTAIRGWDLPLAKFDLPDFDRYGPFKKAVEQGEPTFRPDRQSRELHALWADYPQFANVESFAVFPIVDGERTSAVLSIASSCRLDFTPTFVDVIRQLARSVGFTLKNRQLYFEKNDLQSSAIETATALNIVEVFSDQSHQIRNQLTTMQENLEVVRLKLQRHELGADDVLDSQYFAAVETSQDRLSEILHQADDITQASDDQLQSVSVSSVWANAVDLVQYRLSRTRANPSIRGDCALDAYPVLLRQVFFHLLSNSIRAFDSRRTKDGAITLYVSVDKKTRIVSLRYVDNAGGINPAKLRRRPGHATLSGTQIPPVNEAVFQRGVTSSPKGTGYGLWIVRQILQRHRGSIELVDHRAGVVFHITLPTDLRQQLSRRKEM